MIADRWKYFANFLSRLFPEMIDPQKRIGELTKDELVELLEEQNRSLQEAAALLEELRVQGGRLCKELRKIRKERGKLRRENRDLRRWASKLDLANQQIVLQAKTVAGGNWFRFFRASGIKV